MTKLLTFCIFFFLMTFFSSTYGDVTVPRNCGGGQLFVDGTVVIDALFEENCIWKFQTQEGRVLVFTLVDGNLKEAEEYFSIYDGITSDSPILLVENQKISESSRKSLPQSVYSTQSTASVRFKKMPPSKLQLKIQKATSCPFNLGSASQCGRVVDEVSCYCATFVKRIQTDQTMFCADKGMKLIAFESQAEEELIQSAWDIIDPFWTSLSDIRREGTWIWESTWKFPSTYLHWGPGEPNNLNDEDCMMYGSGWKSNWNDWSCSNLAFAICENQP